MGIKINIFSRRTPPSRIPKSMRSQSKPGTAAKRQLLPIGWRRKFTLGLLAVIGAALLLTLILLIRNWLTIQLPSASDQPEWSGDSELTVALLGLDDSQPGLYFVDSIQIVYFKPAQKQARIMSVDPQLSIDLPQLQDLGRDTTATYQYSQVLNYYLAKLKLASGQTGTELSDQELLTQASNEFIFHLETELGLHVDRFLSLRASKFNNVLQPFGYSYLDVQGSIPELEGRPGLNSGSQWLDLQGQYRYASYSDSDPEVRLARQGQLLKNYLGSVTHPNRALGLLGLLLAPTQLSGLDGNFSKGEFWKMYLMLRGIPEYSISSDITDAKLMYIRENHKFLDRKLIDQNLQQLYRNQDVLFEQARVDVINGSQRAGLAGKVRRLLTNYSFTVVRTDNASEAYTHNTLYVTNPSKYSATIAQLKQFFPDLQVRLQEYPGRPTGDMVLVVI
jgi:hypothetical protein